MKLPLIIFMTGLFFGIAESQQSAQEILNKTIERYDPSYLFSKSTQHWHLEEPRVGNPERYSQIKINRSTGSFLLNRPRENRLTSYEITADNTIKIFLDGCQGHTTEEIDTYRLYPEMAKNYWRYYYYLGGLPMVLGEKDQFNLLDSQEIELNGKPCMEVTFVLAEPLFSPQWKVYFDLHTYELVKLIFFDPNQPAKGEYIEFNGIHSEKGYKVPRMKHWYDLETDEYLGSDLLISEYTPRN